MILVPLFADQYGNARRAVRHGLGLTLDKMTWDSKTITSTINTVLGDDKLKHHEIFFSIINNHYLFYRFRLYAKKFSSMLKDKLIPSDKFTNHVIEQIVRARDTWPTVKAAKNLNLFQYFCLDIIFALLCSIVLLVFMFFKLFASIHRLVKKCA